MTSKFQFRIGETETGKPVKLDLDTFVDTRGFLVANSGGGKSNAFRLIVEQTIEHVPWIIIDVDGEYGVMRKAFPNILLVGENGELPVDVRSAGKLAQKIVELRVSTIIDLYGLLKIRPEWSAHFLDALIHLKKSLWLDLIVGVDEAQTLAPPPNEIKGDKKYREDLFSARDAMIQVASQGRKQSRGSLVATQRTSKLDSNVRAELRNRFIGLSIQKLDRANNADELGLDRKAAVELQGLPAGVFHGFGPAFVNQRGIVLFRFDLAQTKEPPRKERNAPPPASDAVHQIVNQIGDLPKQVQEEEDALSMARREIVDLRRKIAERPVPVIQVPSKIETKVERVEIPVFKDTDISQLNEFARALDGTVMVIKGVSADIAGAISAARQMKAVPVRISAPVARRTVLPVASAVETSDAQDVTRPQQAILDALARLESWGLHDVVKQNAAVFADQSPSSSGFTNNLGRLRSWSLIEYPTAGRVALTDIGRGRANPVDPIRSVDELHQAWYAKLSRPKVAILSTLISRYPNMLTKDELAQASGQSATSSGFTNNLGALRSLGIIDYPQPGYVAATKLLFPDLA